jgi:hypothetical protein
VISNACDELLTNHADSTPTCGTQRGTYTTARANKRHARRSIIGVVCHIADSGVRTRRTGPA